MAFLNDKFNTVLARIAAAESAAGRPAGSVRLLAVSKTRRAAEIVALHGLGQDAYGENQLQDAASKLDALSDLALEWHFIGSLQSNKTRTAAERFAWVHSIDRLKIAQRLSAQRPPELPPLQVCLQVNISGEASKSGVSPELLGELAADVATLPRLRLRGLMAIPAPCTDAEAERAPFRALRHLVEALRTDGFDLDTLSMGMSGDLEAAIAEGATIVRIGTALFGPRLGDPLVKS